MLNTIVTWFLLSEAWDAVTDWEASMAAFEAGYNAAKSISGGGG